MSMRIGINAGFGESISHEFDNFRRLKFNDVRQDMQYAASPAHWQYLRSEFHSTDITPLYIVAPHQVVDLRTGDRAELCNEPNLYMTPAQYAEQWNKVVEDVIDNEITLFFGSISNLNKAGIKWLQDAWSLVTHKPTHVSLHRYPRDGGVSHAHRGFRSRFHEVDAVRQIVGNAELAMTEFGYHTARRWRWGFIPTRWSDIQVRSMVEHEWMFWNAMNFESAYLYQLNDGPSRSYLDRFGIRRVTGEWKPSATAHRRF